MIMTKENIYKVIPDGWKIKRMSEIGTFSKGKGLSASDYDDLGNPCILYGDIYVNFNTKFKKPLNRANQISCKRSTKCKKNDLLFTCSGETAIEIGKTIVYLGDEELYVGGDIAIFTPNSENEGLFLSYQQNSYQLIKQKARYGQGFSVVHIYPEMLKKLIVLIPPKKEQIKISKIINILDEKIELKKKYYGNLMIYKENISERLIYENNSIDKLSIQEMIDNKILKKITGNLLGKFDGEKKYLSTSSIEATKIIKEEAVVTYNSKPSRAQLKPIENSVWFAKMSNTVKVIKADKNLEKNYILSTGFYGFICSEKNINSDYFFQVFLTKSFNRQKDRFSEGSSQVALKDNILSDIFVPLYSVDEQKKISNLLKSFDLKLKLLDDELKLLEKQKKGLMQQLLTGLIRVNVDEQ